MRRSERRILTTHTGSLPRPEDLKASLVEVSSTGRAADEAALRPRVQEAVRDVVRRQQEIGVDVVSDGEMGKTGFNSYVLHRLTGFTRVRLENPMPFPDVEDFPELKDRPDVMRDAGVGTAFHNDGPIAYAGHEALQAELDDFRTALSGVDVAEAFLPAISPGAVGPLAGIRHADRRDYLFELADALREEYRAIVDAGFVLQVDAPDLAAARSRHPYAEMPLEDFRTAIGTQVDALNRALDGIDPDRVRLHVCWGNIPGPHHRDVPLRDIIDILYRADVSGLAVEGANPRHEHEWAVFREQPLPPGKVLLPGVIDSCTLYIEHPELVAQRIVRYAGVVGRENVIPGTDCGFGTLAGLTTVVPGIVEAKLASLVEGARLASAELW